MEARECRTGRLRTRGPRSGVGATVAAPPRPHRIEAGPRRPGPVRWPGAGGTSSPPTSAATGERLAVRPGRVLPRRPRRRSWALADHLGWDEVSSVGHSLGGVVAQLMALEAPDRVGGLVLVASIPGRSLRGLDEDRAAAGHSWPAAAALVQACAGRCGCGRRPRPGSGRRDGGAAGPTSGPGAAHSRSCSPALPDAMFRAPDRTSAPCAGLDVPTLVVGGALDCRPPRRLAALAEAIPGARLVVLDGVGHEPALEAPEQLVGVVGPVPRRPAAGPGSGPRPGGRAVQPAEQLVERAQTGNTAPWSSTCSWAQVMA